MDLSHLQYFIVYLEERGLENGIHKEIRVVFMFSSYHRYLFQTKIIRYLEEISEKTKVYLDLPMHYDVSKINFFTKSEIFFLIFNFIDHTNECRRKVDLSHRESHPL